MVCLSRATGGIENRNTRERAGKTDRQQSKGREDRQKTQRVKVSTKRTYYIKNRITGKLSRSLDHLTCR